MEWECDECGHKGPADEFEDDEFVDDDNADNGEVGAMVCPECGHVSL